MIPRVRPQVRECKAGGHDYLVDQVEDGTPQGFCSRSCSRDHKTAERRQKRLLSDLKPRYRFQARDGVCEVCRERQVAQWHHLISQQDLRHYVEAQRLPELEARRLLQKLIDDPANHLRVCVECHMAHEGWSEHGARRLTRADLPRSVWLFAEDLKLVHLLEREYQSEGEER